jgi:uncharacterized protein with HEPN domain
MIPDRNAAVQKNRARPCRRRRWVAAPLRRLRCVRIATLRRLDPALAADIPELPRIVAFRNILVHGYATVDNRLVWGVVERDLAGLRDALARLLPPA